MATACIPQVTFGFESKAKPVIAAFDMPHASADGGAVLLKSLDTVPTAPCLRLQRAGLGADGMGTGARSGGARAEGVHAIYPLTAQAWRAP